MTAYILTAEAASFFEAHDHCLDGIGKLVGVAHRTPGSVRQSFKPVVLVAIEYLVAGLA